MLRVSGSRSVGAVGSPGRHLRGFQLFDQGPLGLGSANRGRGPANGAPPPERGAIPLAHGRPFSVLPARAVSAGGLAGGVAPVSLGALREVPSFRTQYSDTYASASGVYQAKVYSGPVNYRAADGSWQPIDDSLVATGLGFVNRANSYQVHLPSSLAAGPVQLTVGGDSVSMRVEGTSSAARMASVSGSTAVYAGVLQGLDVSYQSLPGAVKESLTLASASAGSTIKFELHLSSDLHAVEHDGAILLQDSSGNTKIGMPAPFMTQAAKPGAPPVLPIDQGAVGVSMASVSGGVEVTYTPDSTWLAAAGRRFPVTLDPTFVAPGESSDCALYQAFANTSYCSQPQYMDVGANGNGTIDRTLMNFQGLQGALPADSQVLGAAVYMNVAYSSANNGYVVVPMTRQFTSLATWNSYDGQNNWTTPGGDWEYTTLNDGVTPIWQATGTVPATATSEQVSFDITPMTQSWVDGSRGVPSLMISENMAAGNAFLIDNNASGAGPYMSIEYTPRLGSDPGSTIDSTQLTDRTSLGVNVANGNLVLSNNDLHVAGTGLDLSVPRTYNGLDRDQNSFGHGWGNGIDGSLPYIYTLVNDALYLVSPDGSFSVWDADPNNPNGVITPPGLDASMCSATTQSGCPGLLSGADLQVDFRSGERWEFAAIDGIYRLIADTDQNGNTISYQHNGPNGSLSQITDSQGRTTTFSYGTNALISTITDTAGARTLTYTQNAAGQLTSYKDAAGKTTGYSYDGAGNLTQITDPTGEITKILYTNVNGVELNTIASITRVTNNATGAGDSTSYAYGPPSNCAGAYGQTTETDPKGNQTIYCYDTHDRVYKTVDAYGYQTTATYDLDDNVTQDTQPTSGQFTGGTSSICYDSNAQCAPSNQYAAGCERPIARTDPLALPGSSTTASSSDSTYPSSCMMPGGQSGSPTNFEPVTTTNPTSDPQGDQLSYGYDSNGNLQTITDQLSSQNTITIHHNLSSHGLVDYTIDADGARTNYGYDSQGNLTSVTPPSPLGAISSGYDGVSRQTSETDGNGNKTQYQYDALDRVTKATYQDGSTTTYTYDADGNLLKQVDSKTGTTTYTYDLKNRPLSEADPAVAGQPATTTSYTHDGADNLASVKDAGGTVGYGYDKDNRLASVQEPSVSSPITFAYDVDGRRICTSYPNGVAVQNLYDTAGDLLSIKAAQPANGTGATCNPLSANGTPNGNVFSSYTYTYNQGSTDTGLRQTLQINSGAPYTYYYDSLNRLEEAAGGGLSQSLYYTYDGDGNLLSKTNVNGTVNTHTYNSADQITSPGYSYDATGNMLNRPDVGGTTSLAYNPRNQTTSINPDGVGAQPLAYHDSGQSEATQIGKQPGGGKAPALENNTLGISAQEAAVPLLGAASITYYTRDASGTLLSERTPKNGNYYYIEDANGSIIALTDSNGSIANTDTYDPWGQTTTSTGITANSFGFDQGFQSQGGLYHFGHRYYDPTAGAWTQLDPKAHPTDPTQAGVSDQLCRHRFSKGESCRQQQKEESISHCLVLNGVAPASRQASWRPRLGSLIACRMTFAACCPMR